MLCAGFIFTTAGCSSELQELPEETVTLRLWHYWDLPDARQKLRQLVEEFNQSQEGIEIEISYVPDEDLKKNLALAIADGKEPDLAIVDSSDVRYYNRMSPLMDVSDYVEEERYLDVSLASCQEEDGRLLGLPLGVNCLVMYYNESMLERRRIKPPTNLEEFLKAAAGLTTDTRYGCAFPSLQSEESAFCFLPLLWAEGGNIEDINSPAGYRAFDVLRQLVRNGGMSHRTVNMTLSDIVGEFAKGNLGMIFGTSGREKQIHEANPRLNFNVAPLPCGEDHISIIGGEVLTIMRSEHEQECLEFLTYLADTDQIKGYLSDMMYLSAREDLLAWQMEQEPEMEKYLEVLKTARAREFTPYWPAISMAVADRINQVILEEDEPDFLEKLAAEIQTIREADE